MSSRCFSSGDKKDPPGVIVRAVGIVEVEGGGRTCLSGVVRIFSSCRAGIRADFVVGRIDIADCTAVEAGNTGVLAFEEEIVLALFLDDCPHC